MNTTETFHKCHLRTKTPTQGYSRHFTCTGRLSLQNTLKKIKIPRFMQNMKKAEGKVHATLSA